MVTPALSFELLKAFCSGPAARRASGPSVLRDRDDALVQAALVRAPSFQQMLLATPNLSPVEFRRSLVADLALWEPVVKARIEDRLNAQEACKPDHSPPLLGCSRSLGTEQTGSAEAILSGL